MGILDEKQRQSFQIRTIHDIGRVKQSMLSFVESEAVGLFDESIGYLEQTQSELSRMADTVGDIIASIESAHRQHSANQPTTEQSTKQPTSTDN